MSKQQETAVTMDGLVRDLLRLDPVVLATMGAAVPNPERAKEQGDLSQCGLNALLRKVLGLVLALADDEGAVVRLKTERTARANGWPDARTADVGMLLAWALLHEDRKFKGLPPVPLLAAGPDDEGDGPLDPAHAPGGRRGPLATHELVQAVRSSPTIMIGGGGRARQPAVKRAQAEGAPVASTDAVMRELLGLDPKVLANHLERRSDTPGAAYARNPDGMGRAGLNILLRDALDQYHTMRLREVDEVRLMGEADAEEGGRPDARSANFATVLSCGLMCEDRWEVTFLPPRPASTEREEVLKAVARYVYFEGSKQAYDALQLLCDENVHFGAGLDSAKANRLFLQAGAEHDAARGRLRDPMPFALRLRAAAMP